MQVSAAALKVMLTLVSASPEYLGGGQLNSVCSVTVRPFSKWELQSIHPCALLHPALIECSITYA